MKKNNIFKIIFIFTFLVFLIVYGMVQFGYYDYQIYKTTVFTKEQIERFESDVKSGKNVDINDYQSKNKKVDNKEVHFGLKISRSIEFFFKKGIVEIFKILSKIIEN